MYASAAPVITAPPTKAPSQATALVVALMAESAMVAGLLVAPSRYSPYRNPKYAYMRQGYVLNRLLADNLITKDQYTAAKSESIKYQKEVITNGLDLFEKLFGFRSKFFVPPNGPFNNQLEKIAKNSGIMVIPPARLNRPIFAGVNSIGAPDNRNIRIGNPTTSTSPANSIGN